VVHLFDRRGGKIDPPAVPGAELQASVHERNRPVAHDGSELGALVAAMLDSALMLSATGALPKYADQLSRGAYALAEALDDLEKAEQRVAELEIEKDEVEERLSKSLNYWRSVARGEIPSSVPAQEQRAETKRRVRGPHT
jgi:hypothetical protein